MFAPTGIGDKCASPATGGRSGRRGGLCLRGLTMMALAAGPMAWVNDSHALADGQVEPFVAQTLVDDDNVFRRSGQLDPTGDTYLTTTVGLNLDVPVGRQRILGGLSFNDNRYRRFTVLDYTERHGRAIWQWAAGSDFGGELGYTTDRALASLANVEGGSPLGTPNALETRKTYLNAAYLLTPRWRLRGEASRLEQSNELAERMVNDIRSEGAGLTLSYVTPGKNQIGLGLHTQDATLPNQQSVSGMLVDNSYRQNRVNLVADWTFSARSRLRANTGRVERSFAQLPERDFTLTGIFNATYEWQPTGRLTFVATAQKDIAAPDEINAGVNIGFVLVTGIALRPAYRMTDKVSVSGLFDYSDWEYLGDPGLVLGTVPPRSDRVRTAGLAIAYQPIRTVRLLLGLRHESRSSTAAFGDYQADIASLNARLAF